MMMIHKLLSKITPISVYAFLVESAKEMASQSTELAVAEKKSAEDISKQYNELVTLGLGGTQNAKVLKARLDEVAAHNEDILKAEGLIQYIKRINKHFGGHSFIVSKEKFEKLCKRYDLSVGLLTDYNGVIPERNIREIAEARKAAISFEEVAIERLNSGGFLTIQFYETIKRMLVKRVHLNGRDNADYETRLTKYLKNNNNIIEVRVDKGAKGTANVFSHNINVDFGSITYPRLTEIFGKIIDNDTFFIACPKKYLNNAEVEISRTPVDPVVFQYCPYGVLVHSVWGEEAEDKVLREYMEFNKLI